MSATSGRLDRRGDHRSRRLDQLDAGRADRPSRPERDEFQAESRTVFYSIRLGMPKTGNEELAVVEADARSPIPSRLARGDDDLRRTICMLHDGDCHRNPSPTTGGYICFQPTDAPANKVDEKRKVFALRHLHSLRPGRHGQRHQHVRLRRGMIFFGEDRIDEEIEQPAELFRLDVVGKLLGAGP